MTGLCCQVLITVGGRGLAKLTGLPKPVARPSKREWLDKLARLRVRTATGRPGPTVVAILAEARGEFPVPCGPAQWPCTSRSR